MVYSNLLLSNNMTSQAAGGGSDSKIQVLWNGSGLHKYAGPVPFVDISSSINSNSNGIPESVTTSINIEGKIVRYSNLSDNSALTPPTGGISGIIGAIEQIKKLFEEKPYGTFEIKCDSNTLYSASGVVIKSTNFNKTGNNWITTADYTIALETTKSLSTGNKSEYVTDRSISWNVEQIEDASYTDMSMSLSQKAEYSNPVLGATDTNHVPATNIGGTSVYNGSVGVRSVPQFRITRRVSARGLVPPNSSGTGGNDLVSLNALCIRYAKDWVNEQLASGIVSNGSYNYNDPYVNVPFYNSSAPSSGTWLYNHVRSVSIDRTTYEVSDTWLAMPSGIPYTETYSLECSSGEDYIKTVRVVGNIVGLNIAHDDILRGNSGILPSGTTGSSVTPSSNIPHKIDLSYSISSRPTESTNYKKLDDSNANGQSSSPSTFNSSAGSSSNIYPNKYQNALSGWLYDIKPYLYKRACIAINTPDRSLDYVTPDGTTPRPLNNPIYSKESLLGVNPVNVTEGHDPRKGTISYSVEYNNKFVIITGVVSENIDISYDVPHDSVSEVFVPGRALGPILARTGRSAMRKTININVVVVPPTGLSGTLLRDSACPLWTGGTVYSQIKQIINGNKPYTGSALITRSNDNGIVYTQNDTEQWNPSQGRYSRNVSWVYQQCDITKTYLDH